MGLFQPAKHSFSCLRILNKIDIFFVVIETPLRCKVPKSDCCENTQFDSKKISQPVPRRIFSASVPDCRAVRRVWKEGGES